MQQVSIDVNEVVRWVLKSSRWSLLAGGFSIIAAAATGALVSRYFGDLLGLFTLGVFALLAGLLYRRVTAFIALLTMPKYSEKE